VISIVEVKEIIMNKKAIAIKNDNRLMPMAFYHETCGLTKRLKDPNQIHQRFAYFKGLVMRGEFSIDELEDKIYENNGIME